MTVNYDFYDNVAPDTAVEIVDQLRNGLRPPPTRGARLCSLKEMSLQLAGFPDARPGAVADGVTGEATLRGNRLADRYGISVAGFDPSTPIGRTADKPATPAGPPPVAKAEPAAKAEPSSAPPGSAAEAEPARPEPGRDVPAPDQKSPEVRAAETRNPDAATAVPDTTADDAPTDGAPSRSPAEGAGAAANPPASDGKPAGDTGGEQALERNLKEAQ
jgi:NADH-quinone oxidoreductase subunit E